VLSDGAFDVDSRCSCVSPPFYVEPNPLGVGHLTVEVHSKTSVVQSSVSYIPIVENLPDHQSEIIFHEGAVDIKGHETNLWPGFERVDDLHGAGLAKKVASRIEHQRLG